MFEGFFNNCEIRDKVPVSEDQSKNIRSSLQKRLAGDHQQPEQSTKEEKIMKRSTTIRTVLIAAAVAAAGAVSLIGSANTVPASDLLAADNSVVTDTDVSVDGASGDNVFEADTKEIDVSVPTQILHQQILEKLSGKNTFSEEYDKAVETGMGISATLAALNGTVFSPHYEDMAVTELIVAESSEQDLYFMSLEGIEHCITLAHCDQVGGCFDYIYPDGNGGYMYDHLRDYAPIEDEQLLAAIAEGTEKYGDTFTIYY